jgi:integrase
MEVSKLGTVMRYAGVVMKIAFPDAVGQARPLLNHLGMIGGGGKRERRPTRDEVTRLITQLRDGRGAIYADAVSFAVATTARRGEIVKLLWPDLDEEKKLIQICDRKDPRQKKGNDQWIPLLGDAWDIVQHQSRGNNRIFPVHEQTLSKYFKEACDALGIPDLHFHDLRHEGRRGFLKRDTRSSRWHWLRGTRIGGSCVAILT